MRETPLPDRAKRINAAPSARWCPAAPMGAAQVSGAGATALVILLSCPSADPQRMG
ncbi:hypothetical protein NOLU111490_01905 [Novosphingobium lubricantis]